MVAAGENEMWIIVEGNGAGKQNSILRCVFVWTIVMDFGLGQILKSIDSLERRVLCDRARGMGLYG